MTAVIATGKTRHPEFCQDYPLYKMAWADYVFGNPCDRRVSLPDGTPVFALDCDSEIGLFTEAVSMDAGDNVIRERKAASQTTVGIAAPVVPRTNVRLTVVGKNQVGWLELVR